MLACVVQYLNGRSQVCESPFSCQTEPGEHRASHSWTATDTGLPGECRTQDRDKFGSLDLVRPSRENPGEHLPLAIAR